MSKTIAEPKIHRNHPKETWAWIWPDVLIRLGPFWLVSAIAAHYLGGWQAIGWVAPPQGWGQAILPGLGIGLVMLAAAIIFRHLTAPWYRLPTHGDQALQTFFYLVMNAPTEEIFWRGVVQTLAIKGMLLLHASPLWSTISGITLVSIIFGAYHRLGGYAWNFNIAAMAAGAVFGTLYILSPAHSLVAVTIVHGMTTAGYLSWGDVTLHIRHMRRIARARAA